MELFLIKTVNGANILVTQTQKRNSNTHGQHAILENCPKYIHIAIQTFLMSKTFTKKSTQPHPKSEKSETPSNLEIRKINYPEHKTDYPHNKSIL